MVYADDSFYIVSDKDQDRLTNKLSDKFSVMAEYLTANRLKVNSDKTHIKNHKKEESYGEEGRGDKSFRSR